MKRLLLSTVVASAFVAMSLHAVTIGTLTLGTDDPGLDPILFNNNAIITSSGSIPFTVENKLVSNANNTRLNFEGSNNLTFTGGYQGSVWIGGVASSIWNQLDEGAVLTFEGGDFAIGQSGPTGEVPGPVVFNIHGGTTVFKSNITHGSVNTSTGALVGHVLQLSSNAHVIIENTSAVTLNHTFNISADSHLDLYGTVSHSGINGAINVNGGTFNTYAGGTVNGTVIVASDATATNNGTWGTLVVNAGGTATNAGTVSAINAGGIVGTFLNSGTITQLNYTAHNQTFTLNGGTVGLLNITGSSANYARATITGTGSIGSWFTNNHGSLTIHSQGLTFTNGLNFNLGNKKNHKLQFGVNAETGQKDILTVNNELRWSPGGTSTSQDLDIGGGNRDIKARIDLDLVGEWEFNNEFFHLLIDLSDGTIYNRDELRFTDIAYSWVDDKGVTQDIYAALDFAGMEMLNSAATESDKTVWENDDLRLQYFTAGQEINSLGDKAPVDGVYLVGGKPIPPFIKATPRTSITNVDFEESTVTFDVTTNQTGEWTVTSNDLSWLSVTDKNQAAKTFTVKVEANDDHTDGRTGTLTLKIGEVTSTVTITQKAFVPSLTVTTISQCRVFQAQSPARWEATSGPHGT